MVAGVMRRFQLRKLTAGRQGEGVKMPSGAAIGSQSDQIVSLRNRAARIRALGRKVGDPDSAARLNRWADELEDRASKIAVVLARSL
jgi:hypothetical protein